MTEQILDRPERIAISKFITKDISVINEKDRIFEAILMAEMLDKQGEITPISAVEKVVDIWLKRGGPMSDTHSNKYVGKGISWQPAVIKFDDDSEVPAIKIKAMIFSDYEYDDIIWNKIKSGEYKGVSFGGSTKSGRKPVQLSNGRYGWQLGDLEMYEAAVCESPAVPLSIITGFNSVAKSACEKTGRMELDKTYHCVNGVCLLVNKTDLGSIEKDDEPISFEEYFMSLPDEIAKAFDGAYLREIIKPDDARPPKKFWEHGVKRIQEENPGLSEERAKKIHGANFWHKFGGSRARAQQSVREDPHFKGKK